MGNIPPPQLLFYLQERVQAETWKFSCCPDPHEALEQEGLRRGGSGPPSRLRLCRMFGGAAVLLINYSWNAGHPASQPRIFSLFSAFFCSASSPDCSACFHLTDGRQKPGEQFVTKYSSPLLSVCAFFFLFLGQHLLRSTRSPAAACAAF